MFGFKIQKDKNSRIQATFLGFVSLYKYMKSEREKSSNCQNQPVYFNLNRYFIRKLKLIAGEGMKGTSFANFFVVLSKTSLGHKLSTGSLKLKSTDLGYTGTLSMMCRECDLCSSKTLYSGFSIFINSLVSILDKFNICHILEKNIRHKKSYTTKKALKFLGLTRFIDEIVMWSDPWDRRMIKEFGKNHRMLLFIK